jgi:hypothetical protein
MFHSTAACPERSYTVDTGAGRLLAQIAALKATYQQALIEQPEQAAHHALGLPVF